MKQLEHIARSFHSRPGSSQHPSVSWARIISIGYYNCIFFSLDIIYISSCVLCRGQQPYMYTLSYTFVCTRVITLYKFIANRQYFLNIVQTRHWVSWFRLSRNVVILSSRKVMKGRRKKRKLRPKVKTTMLMNRKYPEMITHRQLKWVPVQNVNSLNWLMTISFNVSDRNLVLIWITLQ